MAVYTESPDGKIELKSAGKTQAETVQVITDSLISEGKEVSPCVKDILKTPNEEIK